MLLGRDRERAQIEQLLRTAQAGRFESLLVLGEAGMGKSALLAYTAANASGMLVLRARGVEAESELAFSALADLLRPALGRVSGLPPPQARALSGALALGPPAGGDRFAIY